MLHVQIKRRGGYALLVIHMSAQLIIGLAGGNIRVSYESGIGLVVHIASIEGGI